MSAMSAMSANGHYSRVNLLTLQNVLLSRLLPHCLRTTMDGDKILAAPRLDSRQTDAARLSQIPLSSASCMLGAFTWYRQQMQSRIGLSYTAPALLGLVL